MYGILEPLSGLLTAGEVVLQGRPEDRASERAKVVALLRSAFAQYQLDLAGPRLPFDEPTALVAARWCLSACWFVVSREEPEEVVEATLHWLPQFRNAAEHLAADLTLRYVPQIMQRARLAGRDNAVVRAIGELAGRVPLLGVRLDGPPGPAGVPTSLGGHDGLHLLYAERFAANPRLEWLPAMGPLRLMCERVLARQRRELPRPIEQIQFDPDNNTDSTPRDTR